VAGPAVRGLFRDEDQLRRREELVVGMQRPELLARMVGRSLPPTASLPTGVERELPSGRGGASAPLVRVPSAPTCSIRAPENLPQGSPFHSSVSTTKLASFSTGHLQKRERAVFQRQSSGRRRDPVAECR
jgi:hypothetical protein